MKSSKLRKHPKAQDEFVKRIQQAQENASTSVSYSNTSSSSNTGNVTISGSSTSVAPVPGHTHTTNVPMHTSSPFISQQPTTFWNPPPQQYPTNPPQYVPTPLYRIPNPEDIQHQIEFIEALLYLIGEALHENDINYVGNMNREEHMPVEATLTLEGYEIVLRPKA